MLDKFRGNCQTVERSSSAESMSRKPTSEVARVREIRNSIMGGLFVATLPHGRTFKIMVKVHSLLGFDGPAKFLSRRRQVATTLPPQRVTCPVCSG
jgi:hypothetical protein